VSACTQEEAAARAALIDVESYQVFIDLTAGDDTVRSLTEVRFACREPGAATFADMTAPTVSRVVLNGENLDPARVLADGRIRLRGLAAANVLTVEAESGYATDGRGLTRFTDPSDRSVYLLANCFPTSAPRVCCCFDQPDLPAALTLTVSAPAGWECAAISPLTSRPAAGEAGLWRFETTPPVKPYELTLCAGPYVTVADEEFPGLGGPVRLTVRCRPRLAGEPALARIGGVVRRTLRYYEQLLGVACPYREYHVVCAPELAATAMQVPALMVVSEPLLQRGADQEDDFFSGVLAHEVAHVWFGCMVEGAWWDDLWLGEAMAEYLSLLAEEEALDLEAKWARFGLVNKALVYQADSVPGTPPVSSPVADAADALSRPVTITYSKGCAVIAQLAALIGDEALRAGLRDYLTRYARSATTLADLVGCWSRACGRDLTGWAGQWLQTPGVNTLRPELALAADGTVGSLTVRQEPGPVLRTHRVAVGLYGWEGGRLRRQRVATAEISGAATVIPELAGAMAPDAVVVNDGDLTLAKVRLDEGSLRALTACAMDVGDPRTEAVGWNAAWEMVTTADLRPADFTELVARRLLAGHPPEGLAHLLQQALTAADYYAPPAQRAALRERLADAALAAALDGAGPRHRTQRALTVAFAASAYSDGQLALLRSWLDGTVPGGTVPGGTVPGGTVPDGTARPGGVTAGLELRATILATLSARGLASDADLDAYAADDPVAGERHRATCRALRPDRAAKEAAWTAALAPGQSIHMARAQAQGIWVPGQEDIMLPFRERYFTEALPALAHMVPRIAARIARLLYPATLPDPATIAATDAALERGGLTEPVRLVLAEGRMTAQQVLAARASATPGAS
jgi:aminopeptidase N